jgi:hypothetical protein
MITGRTCRGRGGGFSQFLHPFFSKAEAASALRVSSSILLASRASRRLRLELLILCSLHAHVETRATVADRCRFLHLQTTLALAPAGRRAQPSGSGEPPGSVPQGITALSRSGAARPTMVRNMLIGTPIVCAAETGSRCCSLVGRDGPASWRRRRHACIRSH